MITQRPPRHRSAPSRGSRARAAAAALDALSSRECVVLGLLLVERLSLVEAAVAMEASVPQLRREYEAAVARVRRALAPMVRAARAGAAASRPPQAWRRAS